MENRKRIIFACFAAIGVALIAVSLLTLRFGKQEESQTLEKGRQYNILVTGCDKVSGLYDAMMLVSVDTERERICVLQLPRDTYAEYTEGSYRKLNGAARSLGGDEELCEFLEKTWGITLDGYVSLDLDSFRNIVDTLGGVEIELERDMRYTDEEQGLYIDLNKGTHLLNGRQAEMLVRYRKGYADGDLGRIDMQKRFLAAFFDTLKESVRTDNAIELAEQLLTGVDTNIPLHLALAHGLYALSIPKSNLFFATLPGEALRGENSGAWYFILSAPATDRLLCEYFGKNGQTAFDSERIFCYHHDERFSSVYESDAIAQLTCAESPE